MAAAGKGKGKDGKGKGKGKALAIVLAAKAKGKGKGKKGSGTPDQKETVESPVRNMEESEVGHTPSMDEHEKKETKRTKRMQPDVATTPPEKPLRKKRKCEDPRYQKQGSQEAVMTAPQPEEGQAEQEVGTEAVEETEERPKGPKTAKKANQVLSFEKKQSSLKGVDRISISFAWNSHCFDPTC